MPLLLIIFWIIVLICIVFAVRKKNAMYLVLPIVFMGVYVVIEIARLPMPFWEAAQLILNLQ